MREICKKGNLVYQRIADQRSENRLPKLEDAYAISSLLNISMEYLLTGKDSRPLSEEARLVEGDDELKALVRAVDRDRRLLSAVSAVVMSYEDTGIQKA